MIQVLQFPPRSRTGRVLLAALGVAVVVALLALAVERLTGLPSGAALRVDDAVIDETALAARVETLEALYGLRSPDDPDGADRFRRETAKAIAVDTIVQRAAGARGIATGDDRARAVLAASIAEKGPDGRAQFVALLREVGASERDVLDEIVRQQNTRLLVEQVTRDVPAVTDEDVRRAFEERKHLLAAPERRHLRNLVVASRAEADAVVARVAAGEDLAAIARTDSLDPSTRHSGGDLGLVLREQVEPTFADAAFAAAPGALFGPVQTRYGWNVGRVLEVRVPMPATFVQVRDDLRARLRSERADAAWRAWLHAEMQRADVEYADAYRPEDPDSPPRTGPSPMAGAPR